MIQPDVQQNVVVNKPVVVTLTNTKAEPQSGVLTLSVGGEVRSCVLDFDGPADKHDVALAASEALTVEITEWSKPGDSGKPFEVTVTTDDGNPSHRRVIQ
jgi:hypothetical protein